MAMNKLEQYLHEHIPLSKAMDVHVLEANSTRVKLSAPLAPNINHRETVFGGSVSALAILSAWSLLHVRTTEQAIQARLVIQKNTMQYDLPIFGTFTASCAFNDEVVWEKFIRLLQRRKRARISLSAAVAYEDELAGVFSGDFVALL